MKVTMSLLLLVTVVMSLTMTGAMAQDWLKKWLENRDNGNIKKASESSQPNGVLEMLGYGTFGRRSRRSVPRKQTTESSVETDNIKRSETDIATTPESDAEKTSGSDVTRTSESVVTKTSGSDVTKTSGSDVSKMSEREKAEALGRWRLMCPVLKASADVTEGDPASGLSPHALQAVFTIADKNKDGRIDVQELDLYEKLIEAYEICGMLE